MRLGPYLVILLVMAGCCSAITLRAGRRGGRSGVWVAWTACSLALLALGVSTWLQAAAKETPLISYVLLALGPTLASGAVVVWAERRVMSTLATWSLATASFVVAFCPTMLLSYYVLAPLLPSVLGCCPT